ncbi:hypothetical protein IQ230_23485 [Gloeocapsopsis crepidinum LEGE 06123]|uniref:Uncharacterized protein n=1 Tax=Gloeocapsopsis crepidinum LEGE 06123 TaxID=588587 RepID=A0ABR9V177_9CHRO|nr:hypothetical protein [Gloeocapsopsis crepidinum]MBE9193253.1 hypothetical protein [Gloeocapsopsis crepidinum LEGE 06123]
MAVEKKYQPYIMVLSDVYIGMLGIRQDQKNYFNIPDMTAAEKALMEYQGSRKAHKRNIFSNRLDSDTPTRVKTIERVAVIDKKRSKLFNSKGGKPIKIPTELISIPAQTSTAENPPERIGSIRFTTIRFPGAASNAEISRWLALKLKAHTPTYFITPSGVTFPVSSVGTATPTGPTTPA